MAKSKRTQAVAISILIFLAIIGAVTGILIFAIKCPIVFMWVSVILMTVCFLGAVFYMIYQAVIDNI